MSQPGSRRDRLRAATVAAIKSAARRRLVSGGPQAVALRPIARDVGMTAPGLYRYFPSLDDLVAALVADLAAELTGELVRAGAAVDADVARDIARRPPATSPPPGGVVPLHAGERALAVCRAFRGWAVEHPPEFGLLFGAPTPGPGTAAAGRRIEDVLVGLFTELWERYRFPVPGDVDPDLATELEAWRTRTGSPVPVGAVRVLLGYWARLYGLVALEVFGHLRFAVGDAGPLFEETLREFAEALGAGDAYRRPS